MQVVIEEEEHFIARAARRYEVTEIEGRDGAIFNELGYSYVERPIYVQCLNTNKIDDILAWLDGEGEFEYKGRKTTARFYSQLEPQRETVIRIIDTTFIRDPFWTKLEDEFVEVKGDKEKNAEDENINIKGTIPVKFKEFVLGGNSKQKTRSGKNLLPYPYDNIANTIIQDLEDGRLTLNGTIVENVSKNIKTFDLKAGNYKFLFNNENLPNNSYFYIRNQDTSATLKTNIKTNTTFTLEEDLQIRIYLILVAGTYSNYEMDLMILEATEEDETWEQYGAMPSPEFPSEIQNVEGNVNVSVCNKNLIDTDFFTTENFSISEGNYFRYAKLPDNFKTKLAASMVEKTKQSNLVFALTDTIATTVSYGRVLSKGEITNMTYDFTASDNVYLAIGNSNGFTDLEADLQTLINSYSIQIEYGEKVTDYVEHQEQLITFPLAQGQKLMQGDYLADDGIHHVRKQIELDGTDFSLYSNQVSGRTIYTISAFSNNNNFKTYDSNILCNILKQGNSNNGNNYLNNAASSGNLYVSIENSILGITNESTEEEKLQALQNLIAKTGFFYEGELAEEEIEPYTEEQQEAYNQICNLKAYEEETNIYSTNEISSMFKVTYLEETTEKIENEGNIYSRPILRLEKTSYNNVDIEIAGTRFQYNFNDEEYVEIDCEEKTALYEGLNRNRKLEIGYEFPKLSPGENDIKMNEGDCIIKAKRKDRWL